MTSRGLFFDYYEGPDGVGALIFSNAGLKAHILPSQKRDGIDKIIMNRYSDCGQESGGPEQLKRYLFDYFRGVPVNFDSLELDLDLEGFSDFERMVFGVAQTVSYGKVCSYQQIAGEIGRPLACRAVGNALGKNPIPILIPCHRILRKNGEVGGFSAGLDWKKKLLELEGATKSSKDERRTTNGKN